jgi:hypothetical protein
VQSCPACTALIDVTGQEPFAEVACPGCHGPLIIQGRVGQFELLSVAGRGGMGVVYRARDAGLDREVALKLLRPEHSVSEALITQLETEAAITASINHPNVVKIYSTGVDQGRFYIAMELVDKGSLDDLIQIQGRVSEAQVLEVGIQIARGLRAVHLHGLIHRDVKPGNILFAGPNSAKIVDFGLAIFMSEEESVRGEIWGTPYYVAPEKLDHKPEDFRSDIYSLGGTLFHALCGRPPFEAESASLVALKHLKSEMVSLQAFAPWVSGPTAYVINRTLLKDPEARYQSYDELIEHFEYAKDELTKKAATPAQSPTRVVLETEETRKAMGWLTFAMLGAIVLVAAAAFAFRNVIFGHGAERTPPPRVTQAATPANGANRFKAAWEKLARGDATAAAAFAQLGEKEQKQPDADWLSLGEGLAHLAAGEAAAAQKAFNKISTRGAFASGGEQGQLSEFFLRIARSMDGTAPINPAVAQRYAPNNHEAIALLAFGLKDWQLGRVDDAVAFLRQFRSSSPIGSAEWIAGLKPLATRYLEQFAEFEMTIQELKDARTASAKKSVVEKLNALPRPLAARGRELAKSFAAQFSADEPQLTTPPGPGIYTIANRRSGRCLDVDGVSTAEDANVHQWESTGARNQQWFLKPTHNGFFTLIAEHSGKALDVDGGRREDGVNVRQHTSNGATAQNWKVVPTERGWFKLVAECSGKVLAVRDASEDNGGNVVQWTDNGTQDHEWRFIPVAVQVGEWLARDLGTVVLSGHTAVDPATGIFTMESAGADIWNEQDSCHAALRRITGDFDLVGRVLGIEQSHEYAKAGLMIRDSTAPEARTIFVGETPAHGAEHLRRVDAKTRMTSAKLPEIRAPHWFKIERRGDTIATYHSANGEKWELFEKDTLGKLPAEVLAGIAAASHDENRKTTAKFDHVELRKK